MNPQTIRALNRVIEYVYEDERQNYETSENKEDHIFNDIQVVREWLLTQKNND